VSEDRFEFRGELGAGGMGKVFRVLDRVRGEEVALKTLGNASGRELFRFKREFRALADLVHPNLISLFELFTVESEWMFTMELIEGTGLRTWVRPNKVLDVDRLRDAFRQIADGLCALHAARKVHRDLKPSNVMVQPDGRVVILDFGLVSDVDLRDRTHVDSAIGTPQYMSPEQADDRPLTAASDWYAVGTMLYELLAGRRPFDGPPPAVLAAKRDRDPPPVSVIAPDTPPDLAALCTALMARDPAARPDDLAVLAALGATPSPWTLRIMERVAKVEMVGRDRELAALREALAASRDHITCALVLGPCGSGKSTLLHAFCDELRAGGDAVVLEGRADLRESVPYRALDHHLDALASYLAGLPRAEADALIPPGIALVTRMFPALRRVKAAQIPIMPGELPEREDELHRRAFVTIQEMFRRVAAARPMVATIDDAQWATEPGARLITDFLQGERAPRLLMLFSHRTEDTATPVLEALSRWTGDLRRIQLPALPAVLPGGDVRAGS
jgi:ABC-type cobalamin/Fe3+-siderophores transport system ATPase subunit